MYSVARTSILSDGDSSTNHLYEFEVSQDYHSSDREIYDIKEYWSQKYPSELFEGFDQWKTLLSREEELDYCKNLIDEAVRNKKKIHIANVTCREVAEYIADYYHNIGYFTDYPRKCVIPLSSSYITASIAITSLCYSEKEKNKKPYETVAHHTPIRSSSDQKHLTMMIRTGVIAYVDIDELGHKCIKQLLQEEVFSPFLLGQILSYRAENSSLVARQKEKIQISL